MSSKMTKRSAENERQQWWCLRSSFAGSDYVLNMMSSVRKTIVPYIGLRGRISDFYSDSYYNVNLGFEI